MTQRDAALADVAGLHWADGQAVLSGPLLALADRLDRRFVAMASRWQAAELRFPAFLAAAELERIDWFRSFPHLATFPACLDAEPANLERFAGGQPVSGDGRVQPSALAPIREVLTPAACYHLYAHHRGRRFDGPAHFTTSSVCFRRERHYLPLERQWSFTMREIVCMGTGAEARAFLDQATATIDQLVSQLGLPLRWEPASDPFFQPSKNPRYLMQQVDPTKQELVFQGRLAIASANLHHDHFGRAFGIERATGERAQPVHTACVAFGIERWLAAFIHHFGPDAADWPQVDAVPTRR
ncbi:MAG TPA: aminoacyl--tRNA ligase-related protein [Egibacteraceae bacterium]|nr:aminoacyl--tRNA ligase-related protein [Egibacteraceae bacterium]